MPRPEAIAAALARLHHEPPTGALDAPQLVDHAESSHADDWSLRAALVRFAQPEPTRAAAVLELIRRTDGALASHRRLLDATSVPTDPGLGPGTVVDHDGQTHLERTGPPVLDHRCTDLARVVVRFPDGDTVVAAYAADEEVGDDELALVPLLAVAVELDAIGDVLSAWAADRTGTPPLDAVDQRAAAAFRRLSAIGVPRETGPGPGRGRGRGRGRARS